MRGGAAPVEVGYYYRVGATPQGSTRQFGLSTLTDRFERRDGTSRAVIKAHGAFPQYDYLLHQDFMQQLASNGYSILANGLHGRNIPSLGGNWPGWGSEEDSLCYREGIDYLIAPAPSGGGAKPDKVVLVGTSMGNCSSWNYVRYHGPASTPKVVGIVGIAPVVDLEYMRGTDANYGQAWTTPGGYAHVRGEYYKHISMAYLLDTTHGAPGTARQKTVSSATVASNKITITFSAAHGLAHDDVIYLEGFTPAALNGWWKADVISSSTVLVTYADAALAGVGNATVQGKVYKGPIVSDSEWATISAVHDPMKFAGSAPHLDIPWLAFAAENDIVIGADSGNLERFGELLSDATIVIGGTGGHAGPPVDGDLLVEWIDGLAW